jgi:hypothetical protein
VQDASSRGIIGGGDVLNRSGIREARAWGSAQTYRGPGDSTAGGSVEGRGQIFTVGLDQLIGNIRLIACQAE